MNKGKRKVGAYFYMPLLFLIIGYGIFYLVGTPVIDFMKTTVNLVLLEKPPIFNQKETSIFSLTEAKAASKKKQTEIQKANIKFPRFGDLYGELTVSDVGLDQPLYFGDSSEILAKGVGQFNGSVFPGQKGTTLIGGHNVSAMGRLNDSKINEIITITTNYGVYKYKITDKKVAKYSDMSAFPLDAKVDQVILYTCYPVTMMGLTDDRLVVTGVKVSGPVIIDI